MGMRDLIQKRIVRQSGIGEWFRISRRIRDVGIPQNQNGDVLGTSIKNLMINALRLNEPLAGKINTVPLLPDMIENKPIIRDARL